MRPSTGQLLIASLLVFPVSTLHAQTSPDPSGHWEGTIQSPIKELTIEIDLAKNSAGKLVGTFSNPGQSLDGFPLQDASVDGRSVHLLLKAGSGGGTFDGFLSPDGKWLSGDFTTAQGGFTVPFSLARAGNARIEPPARSAAIPKELDGIWNGTLDINGTPLRLVLTMSNQPDGTATGSIVNVDQGKVEVPIVITGAASNLTLEIKAVGGSYTGALSKEGTELIGTYTEGALVAPLTFRIARR